MIRLFQNFILYVRRFKTIDWLKKKKKKKKITPYPKKQHSYINIKNAKKLQYFLFFLINLSC